MNVCGTFEQMLKSHWDSCASACFESSLDSCVPNSFVKLEKKKVTADGGCNSDGMAWRRYHIPITEEWVALGDLHGYDLRQADAITFAMSPIIATKFPTPVSIVAAPDAKGLFIGTTIAAGYHEQDTITLRQRPDLVYALHYKAIGNLVSAVSGETGFLNSTPHSLLKLFMKVEYFIGPRKVSTVSSVAAKILSVYRRQVEHELLGVVGLAIFAEPSMVRQNFRHGALTLLGISFSERPD